MIDAGSASVISPDRRAASTLDIRQLAGKGLKITIPGDDATIIRVRYGAECEMPEYLKGRIDIIEGDITQLTVDAIVNAANKSLLGGGGVDGAIHRAAGPRLLEETRTLGGCETGEAKISGGYRLPARHVIHTVGPVWHGGTNREPELLADCYRNSLALAVKHGLRTIAFPSISTGIYSYPIEKAAPIALRTVKAFLEENPSIEKVIFCTFGNRDYQVYLGKAEEILKIP